MVDFSPYLIALLMGVFYGIISRYTKNSVANWKNSVNRKLTISLSITLILHLTLVFIGTVLAGKFFYNNPEIKWLVLFPLFLIGFGIIYATKRFK